MVPGMTERERLAADVRLYSWLADATLGPTLTAGLAKGGWDDLPPPLPAVLAVGPSWARHEHESLGAGCG